MPKNYYIILGIPSGSSQQDIKAAYRRLAKKFHPDRYGKGHSPFQNIQEAYSVLGDPSSRQEYDEHRIQQKQRTDGEQNVESMNPRTGPVVEPLSPQQVSSDFQELAPARPFESFRASLDLLFDNIFNNFKENRHAHGGPRTLPTFVIGLTPDQAFSGGHARIMVPTGIRCPTCNGYGHIGSYECWRCSGCGTITGDYPVMISYPPGIPDGHVVRISLARFNVSMQLVIMFRISDLL